jgi:hypothetical protein
MASPASISGIVWPSPRAVPPPLRERDELYAVWTVARAEANLAYDAWQAAPDRDTYAIYRAAEDRADAAQDALAGLAAPLPLAA